MGKGMYYKARWKVLEWKALCFDTWSCLFWWEEAMGEEPGEVNRTLSSQKKCWGRIRPTVGATISGLRFCGRLIGGPDQRNRENESAAGVHTSACSTHNTSGTTLKRRTFPKSHERMPCKAKREMSQCSPGTKILDTASFKKPHRWRSSGSLSSWTLAWCGSELQ